MNSEDIINILSAGDPYAILDIPADTDDDATVESAYEAALKKSPEKKKEITNAFTLLKTAQNRKKTALMGPLPLKDIKNLKNIMTPQNVYTGPGPWLKYLRKAAYRE